MRWKRQEDIAEKILRTVVSSPLEGRLRTWLLLIAILAGIGLSDYLSPGDVSFSIFYLLPVSVATAWRGPVAGVIVALGSTVMRTAGDAISAFPAPLPLHSVWNAGAALVIYFFVVWLLHSLITLHRRLEGEVRAQSNALLESAADRQRLELEVLDISARERSAFGRELHDELGQHFVATAMAVQVLAQKLEDPNRASEAKAIVRWLEEGIAKTRKLARGLLMARIEPERLMPELEELVESARRVGIQGRVIADVEAVPADAAECAQLYRIAQEAIGNALRHGRPREIDVLVSYDDAVISLVVEDDGAGFHPLTAMGAGMGLRIMEHRAKLIGASLAVVSSPGEGTRITCRLPRASAAPITAP